MGTGKTFYVQPLSVPHGELSVLMELFPELLKPASES